MSIAGLSSKYIHLDQQIITECATGLDEWVDVAVRHGFTREEWEKIEARPEVIAAIEKAKQELYDSGVTFKNKSKLCAEHLLDNVYVSAMSNDTPVKDKVSALQAISRLAGLEMGPSVQAQGTGFSIQINLPSVSSKESSSRADVVVEGKGAEVIDPAEASIKLEFKDGSEGQPVRRVAEDDEEESEDGRGERSSEEDTSRDA